MLMSGRLHFLFFAIVAGILLSSSNVFSGQKQGVTILPFSIHSSRDLNHLGDEIPKMMRQDLAAKGIRVLPSQTTDDSFKGMEDIGEKEARKWGQSIGAGYVIWGSLTLIGESFSIDVNMVETQGKTPVFSSFGEGTGIQNLPGVIKKSTTSLSRRILREAVILEVTIKGNNRIEEDAIKRIVKSKKGDAVNPGRLSKDLQSIYQMGYFDDIRVEAHDRAEGKVIVFNVVEKPTIRKITVSGNKVYKNDKIMENLDISTGSILNIFKLNSNIDHIESLYLEKNYHNVNVDYKITPRDNNQADIEFVIIEGDKIRIKTITFEGNAAYDDKALKKLINTSEKGFWSWLTSSGELKKEDLSQDAARLTAFYQNNGFIHAKVAEPVVTYKDNWIYITIKIDEGLRFKTGKIDIEGDLILPKEELLGLVIFDQGEYFSREIVRNNVLMLSDIFSNYGYANANVYPRSRENNDDLVVDITYHVEKGEQVYFEKIVIGGNTKTRDKVIRRELHVFEQELYSGSRLKRSIRNLHRLDFFEDVKVDTIDGSEVHKKILKIDVAEKPTGTFSFGAGYSSVEDVFFTGSVAQRNLFGRGQILKVSGQIGGTSDQYSLSFTEPWMYDIPLSFTAKVYRSKRDYDTYNRTSMGSGLAFSYPVWDYTRASLAYGYDVSDIDEITNDASDNIKDLEGESTTSSVTASIRYDSRDKAFNTTQGGDHRISLTYAGLGGDVGFTKITGETGWFFPFYKELVLVLHGKAGYVTQHPGMKLPDYERFYLGGMNSVRGYEWQDIAIYGTNEAGEETKIGGDKFIQFNIETTFPLIKDAGVTGVVFFDAGNVFATDQDVTFKDIKHSAGGGFRWYSPIGPIRVEYGYILNPKEGEPKGGRWEFSMGAAF